MKHNIMAIVAPKWLAPLIRLLAVDYDEDFWAIGLWRLQITIGRGYRHEEQLLFGISGIDTGWMFTIGPAYIGVYPEKQSIGFYLHRINDDEEGHHIVWPASAKKTWLRN